MSEEVVHSNKELKAKMTKDERDRLCFKLYIDGASIRTIARKVGLNQTTVQYKIQKLGWKQKKLEIMEKMWTNAMTQAKGVGSTIMATLKKSVEDLHKESLTRRLTMEELRELRGILSMLMHEKRLDDGKPTGITDGVVRHEILLPPGVTRFGVDPPSKNVTLLDHVPGEKVEKTFDIEDLEDDTSVE